ncbi:MAG: hypothetical protein ACE5GH_03195 [Fidelibacterota bacterium]
MAIDFGNRENRRTYLAEKFDDLLDGINETYSTVLMDELISRLEKTVNEFNEEVNELMEQLKVKSQKKEKLLEKIRAGGLEESEVTEPESEPERGMSAWEKKLEAMDKS